MKKETEEILDGIINSLDLSELDELVQKLKLKVGNKLISEGTTERIYADCNSYSKYDYYKTEYPTYRADDGSLYYDR